MAWHGSACITSNQHPVLYPILTQLEKVASSGLLFVVVVAAMIVYYSVADGLPAIRSGELPIWRPALAANVPEAIGVLSFA